mgnify:CR=1 FL=1
MPKGQLAYRSPIVLRRVEAEVPEPYRSVLLVHAHAPKANRDIIINAQIGTVATESGVVTIAGCQLDGEGRRILSAYLRDYLAGVESEWLFPLPADASKPANAAVCKRYLNAIVTGKSAPSPDGAGPQELL